MDYTPLRMDASQPPLRVNLYSDTQTRPSRAMKQAMLDAAEVLGPVSGPEIFLPYLSGERTPHNDAHVRGSFHGLDFDTNAARLGYAVMEGVSFGLLDGLAALNAAGSTVSRLSLVGGGARSAFWAQMLASALNVEIVTHSGSAVGGALGAARLGTTRLIDNFEI